jgi:hypothetical protein
MFHQVRVREFVLDRHSSRWPLNFKLHDVALALGDRADQAVSEELAARIRVGENPVLVMLHHGGSFEVFKAMEEDLDGSVGEVMSALRRSGQANDTLVLFISDNGGERFSYNWPFSGEKASLLEGGVGIPTLLSWPGQLRPRQVNHCWPRLPAGWPGPGFRARHPKCR